jgi:cellulose synthase/poly-beta-1,6-N-acetylglucosamine synthase-like glycosyltransferase
VKCLRALTAQDYPRDGFEVIVVDDGSIVAMADSLGSLPHHMNLTLLRQPHSGPARARNFGASRAKGSYLVFTDDDCTPTTDWLRKLSEQFALSPDAVLGGRTVNAIVENHYSAASQLIVDYLYASWNFATRATFFTSNNMAIPAKRFAEIGGFGGGWDRAAGEDRDLCDRLIHHGCRLIYVPDALVHHAHCLTFAGFCRQHFNYGIGAFHLHQLRAHRAATRIRFEPCSFYLNMIAHPFAQTTVSKASFLAILIGLAQAANAVGWMAACFRSFVPKSPERIEAYTKSAADDRGNKL